MNHDLMFPRIAVHWSYGIPDGPSTTFKACLKRSELLGELPIFDCVCRENFDFSFLLRMSGIACFCHHQIGCISETSLLGFMHWLYVAQFYAAC